MGLNLDGINDHILSLNQLPVSFTLICNAYEMLGMGHEPSASSTCLCLKDDHLEKGEVDSV